MGSSQTPIFLICCSLWIIGVCALDSEVDASSPEAPKEIDYLVDLWQQAQGLPQSSVWAITQDTDGYLWIGTEEGLVRFDGQRFIVFDSTNSPVLNDNWFRALHIDTDGTLWAANRGGDLLRYSGQTFQRPGSWPETATNVEVYAQVPHPRGGFWLATDQGLKWLDQRDQVQPVTLHGLPDEAVLALVEGREGALWIGTRQGLFAYREEPPRIRRVADGAIEALLFDTRGRLWIGTGEGLRALDPESSATFAPLPAELGALANLRVFTLLEDHSGSLWIGTDQGVFRLRRGGDSQTFDLENYGDPDVLPDRHVTALFEDAENHMWIGTRYGGLVRFRPRYIRPMGKPEGLSDDLVWSILEDRQGNIWISTDGGLDRLAPDGSLDSFTTAQGLPANDVGALLEDHAGTLWIGTFGHGLVSRRQGAFVVDTSQPVFLTSIRCLYEDHQQRLWIGAKAGLVRRDPGGDRVFTTEDGLPDNNTRGVFQDHDNSLWVITLGGLARYLEGEDRFETIADDFPGRPKSLLGDPDGTLWIGTWDHGLVRFRNGELTSFTVEDGLHDRRIHQIVDDTQGGLWMSSNQGVFRVERQELESFASHRIDKVTSTVLDVGDGMRSAECNGASQPAGLRARDGRLWFPTILGVVAVGVDALTVREGLRRPVIEDLRVDQNPIPLTPRPVLPPRSKTVALRYTAPSFERAIDTRFRYRLVGFDKDWIEAGNERTVQYTNLPPGSYRFEVTARSGGGFWNPQPAGLDLDLRPAFVQTRSFYFLCAVFVVAGAWGLYRLRLHRLLTTNRELESIRRKLEAKNALIQSQNTELEGFTYTVSHDLKNPLFTIQGFLGSLEQDLIRHPERAIADVQRIRGAANKMQRLLDELLELSRIGRQVDPPKAIALGELVREAISLVERQISEQRVRVVVAPNLPVVWGDRTRLLQVFQNLIANAVKYMGDQADPLIEIGARRHGKELLCHVRDNGCGIDPAYHERVFKLFEQLDPEREGTGVGLAIVQRIIEFHQGRIWVESGGSGQGSTFTFSLPAVPSSSEIS